MTKIFDWIKSNMLLALGILAAVVILFFPKIFRTSRRRRRRNRTLPRSVGMYKRRRTRKAYTKGGKAKKAWQIKGSEAARRHMAKIRRMR